MPVEIVVAFVVAALVAIAARLFAPVAREDRGHAQPGATSTRSPATDLAAVAPPDPPPDAPAVDRAPAPPPEVVRPAQGPSGSWIAGTPRPIAPTRFVVSSARRPDPAVPEPRPPALPPPAIPLRDVVATAPTWRGPGRPGSSLVLQRRVAGLLTVATLLAVVVAAGYLPRGRGGQVLSATATPGVIPTAPAPSAADGSTGPSAAPGGGAPSAPPTLPAAPSPTPSAPGSPSTPATPHPTPPDVPATSPPTPQPAPVPDRPEAFIDADVTCGRAPLAVRFDGTGSVRVDSWHWDFGDGTTASGPRPRHSFSRSSTVTLTVTNAAGSDEAHVEIRVGPGSSC